MSLAGFGAVVQELGEALGQSGLQADEEGYLSLTFDRLTLHLQFEPDGDEAALFARIGTIDDDRAEAIYGMLLGANLFWNGTRGGTLAVEPQTNRAFLLERRSFAGMDAVRLKEWLERFLEMAEHWTDRITAANEGGPTFEFDEDVAESPDGPSASSPGRGGEFIRG